MKPILFSTSMIQEIWPGRKTMTRRANSLSAVIGHEYKGMTMFQDQLHAVFVKDNIQTLVRCPYGKPGDILWVRETWQHTNHLGIHPTDDNSGYIYKASENGMDWQNNTEGWKWKPSIFMPKAACRLFLKVTDIRAERLQDISEEDAISEGVQSCLCDFPEDCPSILCAKECSAKDEYYRYPFPESIDGEPCYSAVESFQTLWESINGRESWKANGWVWVISFEQTEKPAE